MLRGLERMLGISKQRWDDYRQIFRRVGTSNGISIYAEYCSGRVSDSVSRPCSERCRKGPGVQSNASESSLEILRRKATGRIMGRARSQPRTRVQAGCESLVHLLRRVVTTKAGYDTDTVAARGSGSMPAFREPTLPPASGGLGTPYPGWLPRSPDAAGAGTTFIISAGLGGAAAAQTAQNADQMQTG